jgi:hypothetical protein
MATFGKAAKQHMPLAHNSWELEGRQAARQAKACEPFYGSKLHHICVTLTTPSA